MRIQHSNNGKLVLGVCLSVRESRFLDGGDDGIKANKTPRRTPRALPLQSNATYRANGKPTREDHSLFAMTILLDATPMSGISFVESNSPGPQVYFSENSLMGVCSANESSVAPEHDILRLGAKLEMCSPAAPDCDACPRCDDRCLNHSTCPSCKNKKVTSGNRYTVCQVRRHNHFESAWLVAGSKIYDATSYIRCHPAGEESILRKSGGAVDVTRDIEFHSSRTQRMMRSLEVGRLIPCGGEEDHQWWKFW